MLGECDSSITANGGYNGAFDPGHDGFVFDSLLLAFYDGLIEELKRRRLTASRYKAKNGYVGLFQFSDNAGREEVF